MNDQTLVATELYDDEELAMIERHTEIIPVDTEDALGGMTNSVRIRQHDIYVLLILLN